MTLCIVPRIPAHPFVFSAARALWSVQADGRVVLAPYRFTENGPEALRLQSYGGRLLQFAHGVALRPNPDYFGRHRTFHGFR